MEHNMFKNKWDHWYDNLPEHTKTYLKNQPLWHDKDLYKAIAMGILIGFFIGVIVGYEWAWTPVIKVFKPLVG